MTLRHPGVRPSRDRSEHAINGLTERRRSRTDRAWGYHTAQVLKTCWATGPMPLREAGYRRDGCGEAGAPCGSGRVTRERWPQGWGSAERSPIPCVGRGLVLSCRLAGRDRAEEAVCFLAGAG